MSLRSEAMDFAQGVADSAIEAIVEGVHRERARQRCQGCRDMIFHRRMVELLPRWRWIARAHHRRMARRAEAHCDALRRAGDDVAIAITNAANSARASGSV